MDEVFDTCIYNSHTDSLLNWDIKTSAQWSWSEVDCDVLESSTVISIAEELTGSYDGVMNIDLMALITGHSDHIFAVYVPDGGWPRTPDFTVSEPIETFDGWGDD